MSHEIRTHDEQHGRKQAWHNLTRVNADLAISSEDFYLASWDAEAVKVQIRRKGQFISLPGGAWETLLCDVPARNEDGELIPEGGTVPLFLSPPYDSRTYHVLTNKAFLGLISSSLSALGISDAVESCGSVFDRRRTFVSIELPEFGEQTLGHRNFKNYLNFINSFDQSVPFLANTSNTCMVCNNTMVANLASGGCLVKHTKNMPDRLVKLPDVISEAIKWHRDFANDFLALESVTIDKQDALSLFVSFVAAGDSLSTRAKNTAERLAQLFGCETVGNRGATLADVFSAITDFYSHESSGGSDKLKQFQSSEFGSGATTKRQAINWLVPFVDKGFDEEAEAGRKLLNEYLAK
jgi:hypothetical protein